MTFNLKNGKRMISTEAPGGLYNADQLKKIAAICDGDLSIVKATEDQRLALFIPEEKVDAVVSQLAEVGLGVRNYQDGLHAALSCVGALCADFQQDALKDSVQVTTELEDIKLKAPLKIGINGCAKCCVPCHTLDIAVVGEAEGYKVYLGGKSSQIPEMAVYAAEGIPAAELSGLLKKIIKLYEERAQDGESLMEVMERSGAMDFLSLLSPYSRDAIGTESESTEIVSTETVSTEIASEHIMEESLSLVEEEMPVSAEPGENSEVTDVSEVVLVDEVKIDPDLGVLDTISGDVVETQASDEEGLLEDKLSSAIEEEGELSAANQIVEQENNERDQALKLMEAATELPSEEAISQEISDITVDTSEDLNLDEHIQLDEVTFDVQEDSITEHSNEDPWMLNDLKIHESNVLEIIFSNGAAIKYDLTELIEQGSEGRKKLNLKDTTIDISVQSGERVYVHVNGMELILPLKIFGKNSTTSTPRISMV